MRLPSTECVDTYIRLDGAFLKPRRSQRWFRRRQMRRRGRMIAARSDSRRRAPRYAIDTEDARRQARSCRSRRCADETENDPSSEISTLDLFRAGSISIHEFASRYTNLAYVLKMSVAVRFADLDPISP